MRIAKEFHWEMGHRLLGHPVCRNVHGHSYRAVVEVEGLVGPDGMVVDYGRITDLVRPLVAELDHAFMVDSQDSAMLGFLEENGLKAFHVDFPSTAENIAKLMLGRVGCPLLEAENVRAVAVRVHETAASVAEVWLRPSS